MTVLDTIVLCVLRVIARELSRTLQLQIGEVEEGIEGEVEKEQDRDYKRRQKQKQEQEQRQGERQGQRVGEGEGEGEGEGDSSSCVLSTCYATLLSIAPLLIDIHPHTADRVVAVVISLSGKLTSRCDVNKHNSSRSSSNNNINNNSSSKNSSSSSSSSNNISSGEKIKCESLTDRENKDIDVEVEVVSEALAVTSQFINVLLRPRVRLSNIRLLYSLMQGAGGGGDGDGFIPALQHSAVARSVNPLIALLAVYDKAVPNMTPLELSVLVTGYLNALEERSKKEGNAVQNATTALSMLRGIINDEDEQLNGSPVALRYMGKQGKDQKEGKERGGGDENGNGEGGGEGEKEGKKVKKEVEMDCSLYYYEEGPSTDAAFLTAAWCYALHGSPDLCNVLPVHSITLFDPYAEGLVHNNDHPSYPCPYSHSYPYSHSSNDSCNVRISADAQNDIV